MKNNFRNKKSIFCVFICFSPQLFYKPYEGKKCTTTALPPNLYNCETVTPGTKQMLQSTQSGDCSSHYATEKQLQELTPATLLHGGQKPKSSLLTLDSPCWAT